MGISDCYISTSGVLQTYQGSDGDVPNITIIYLLYHILPNKRRCFAEILWICTRLNIAELVLIWQTASMGSFYCYLCELWANEECHWSQQTVAGQMLLIIANLRRRGCSENIHEVKSTLNRTFVISCIAFYHEG